MNKQLEEGQIVLCTVTKIIGTVVFVRLDDYNLEGTIVFSEIAPGRIRNIREYAFPGKKIVCKVLQIRPQVIELSFRRVKVNERNDFNDLSKKEKSYTGMLKTLLKEKAEEIITKIKEKFSLVDFLEKAKENPSVLHEHFSKEHAEKIHSIISEKKERECVITKRFTLTSKAPNGLVLIKNIIQDSSNHIKNNDIEVSYISAGKYLAKLKSKDPKTADQQLRKFIENLEASAKKNNCSFSEDKV